MDYLLEKGPLSLPDARHSPKSCSDYPRDNSVSSYCRLGTTPVKFIIEVMEYNTIFRPGA
jgi:hypothetical protein